MKTKKQRKQTVNWGKVRQSFAVVFCLILFNSVLCGLAMALVRDVLIPLATMFSYDLHRYMELLEYNAFYEDEERALALGIYRACAVPTLFLGAPLAFRVAIGRGRKFKEDTHAKIGYAEGLGAYMKEYGRYDIVVMVIMTSLLWLTPLNVLLSPVSTAFFGWMPPIFGWLITVAVSLLTIPVGAFFAQKHWRAQYICAAME